MVNIDTQKRIWREIFNISQRAFTFYYLLQGLDLHFNALITIIFPIMPVHMLLKLWKSPEDNNAKKASTWMREVFGQCWSSFSDEMIDMSMVK